MALKTIIILTSEIKSRLNSDKVNRVLPEKELKFVTIGCWDSINYSFWEMIGERK